MIRKSLVALGAICLSLSGCTHLPAYAQTVDHLAIASQFNNWRVQGSVNLIAGSNPGVAFTPCLVQGDPNHQIPAVAASTPLLIKDPGNPAVDETVTPTSIVYTSNGCTATLTTANAHTTPWYIASGSYGLQEAINAYSTTGGLNVVELDSAWHAAGGTAATVAAAVGNASLSIKDVTYAPATVYGFNTTTSAYIPEVGGIAVPTVAAGAGAGSSPTIAGVGTGNVFQVTLTSGTTPTASATIFTATYATTLSFAYPPTCTVTPIGATPYTGTLAVTYPSSTHALLTYTATSTALTASQSGYAWEVHCQ